MYFEASPETGHQSVNVYHDPGQSFTAPVCQIEETICRAVPVQKIFLLGTYFDNSVRFQVEYDLLVLIESRAIRQMFEYERIISESCKDFAKVTASVDEGEKAIEKMCQGNIFYNRMCDPLNLIYDTEELRTFIPADAKERLHYDILIAEFNFLLFKAKGFLSGAINYNELADYPLAAFMLHQAVEQAMGAYLTPLMGYRLHTHNINKLLFYTRRFSPDFGTLFSLNSPSEIGSYRILHKAYISGRYKCDFKVGRMDICLLIDKVKLLLVLAKDSFYQRLYEE